MERYELRGNVDFSHQKACLIKAIGRRENFEVVTFGNVRKTMLAGSDDFETTGWELMNNSDGFYDFIATRLIFNPVPDVVTLLSYQLQFVSYPRIINRHSLFVIKIDATRDVTLLTKAYVYNTQTQRKSW